MIYQGIWGMREGVPFSLHSWHLAEGNEGAGAFFVREAGGTGGLSACDSLAPVPCPSLTGPSDMQCFTVKPVMNLPRSYKDKPVPEQILK